MTRIKIFGLIAVFCMGILQTNASVAIVGHNTENSFQEPISVNAAQARADAAHDLASSASTAASNAHARANQAYDLASSAATTTQLNTVSATLDNRTANRVIRKTSALTTCPSSGNPSGFAVASGFSCSGNCNSGNWFCTFNNNNQATSCTCADGQPGQQGTQGIQGIQGIQGATGATGPIGLAGSDANVNRQNVEQALGVTSAQLSNAVNAVSVAEQAKSAAAELANQMAVDNNMFFDGHTIQDRNTFFQKFEAADHAKAEAEIIVRPPTGGRRGTLTVSAADNRELYTAVKAATNNGTRELDLRTTPSGMTDAQRNTLRGRCVVQGVGLEIAVNEQLAAMNQTIMYLATALAAVSAPAQPGVVTQPTISTTELNRLQTISTQGAGGFSAR